MRIAIVSDLVRPNGAGVMALLGATMLTDVGHEVVVIAGSMDAALERRLGNELLAAMAFTHDERALDGSVTASDHRAFQRAFRRWFDARLAEWTPDVLYVHNCGRVLDQLDLADLSHQIPLIHTMHDEWFFTDAHYTYRTSPEGVTVRTFEPDRSEHLLEHRFDHLFEIPGRVGEFTAIAPSTWLADRARRALPAITVEHLPNAVDTALFELQDRDESRRALGLPLGRALVLFVGSPTQDRKGFDLFEQAMRTVQSDGAAAVRLVVGGSASLVTDGFASSIGPGPLAERLAVPDVSPVGALGLAGDALVVAGIDRALMPALYGAADLLVHPSVVDNLPTVPIEAGLCGTRCLATDVGGTAETIADVDDLFDLFEDPAVVGAMISQALVDVKAESETDRRARRDRQLERFTVDRHVERLVDVFERSLARATK